VRQGRRHQSARRSAPERNRNRPLGGSTAPCAPRRVVGMAADPRSTFFAEAALHTTGGTGSSADLSGDGAMQRFLEDAACPVLVASCPDGGKVQLSNAVDSAALAASQRPTLVFIKTRPVAINTGNMLTVVTSSTLQSSPLESLAAALAHVYAPLVKEQSGPQAGRLQTVLSELRSGLASELRLKGVSSAGQFNEDDASAVQSPADEFNLWTELAARGDSRAREVAAFFEPIARRWEELPDSTNEEDVLETLETTQDALDDVRASCKPPAGLAPALTRAAPQGKGVRTAAPLRTRTHSLTPPRPPPRVRRCGSWPTRSRILRFGWRGSWRSAPRQSRATSTAS